MLKPTAADRQLCPGEVSSALGLKTVILAQSMRDAGITEAPSVAQARQWKNSPHVPDWVREARLETEHLSRERKPKRHAHNKPVRDADGNILTRLEVKALRGQRKREDLKLCHTSTASILGLRYAAVAKAMRGADVTNPILPSEAKAWMHSPDTMPVWLKPLVVERELQRILDQDRKAKAAEHKRAAEEVYRAQEAARYAQVEEDLERGKKKFTYKSRDIVDDIAFEASKNLARGATINDLSTGEITALTINRINPLDHSSWQVHAGDCSGEGANCKEGKQEAEIAKVMANLERQQERAQWSSDNAEQVASGRFDVGQMVSAWNGDRIGMVVKKNRVTVKVRMVGPRADSYRPAEKAMKPHFLSPTTTDPSIPEIGEKITVKSWDGREREMVVVDVLKPLFLAEYKILSGETRQAWFDSTRVVSIRG